VTSAAKWRANRRNARKCTGPRAAQGRARSARNARRHGLTRSARFDRKLAQVIATLAQAIAGEGADAARRARAGEIALAQVEVMRVRQARRDLYVRALDARPFNGGDVIKRMTNLARYERRALAGRKRAIRRFDAAPEPAGAAVSQLFDKTKPKALDRSDAGARAAAAAAHAGKLKERALAASRGPRRRFFAKRNQKRSMNQWSACRTPRPRWPAQGRTARPPPSRRRPRFHKLIA
jgi:hypothetical protein